MTLLDSWPLSGHSFGGVTQQRQWEGVDRVLASFEEKRR
jgi:hypothetical protein